MTESVLHVQWQSWDNSTDEQFALRWDNGGWVAEGSVSGANVHYVLRLGENLDLRQFLLFRDLDEPDLWLVRDSTGRWGEMNGGERQDLLGCGPVSLGCSPSATLIAIRSLDLEVGGRAELMAATVDTETLSVVPAAHVFTRLDTHRWHLEVGQFGFSTVFDVDDEGVLIHSPGWFRRVAPPPEWPTLLA